MTTNNYTFLTIPIEHIYPDIKQPRLGMLSEEDCVRLITSIQQYGVLSPIAVIQAAENEYTIMDGHRRYFSAKHVGLKEVPCNVYQRMPEGELESRRYEIQTNRKNWKPIERSQVLKAIRDYYKFNSNRALAEHLNISETLAANSLQLGKERMQWIEVMAQHKLLESYQTEFMRLKSKLRRIKDLEVDQIAKIIFKKVEDDVITNSRDFRILGKLFKRGTVNEDALYRFLSKPDATMKELLKKTSSSSVALCVDDLMNEMTERLQKGAAFDPQEENSLRQLITFITDSVLSK